MEEQGLVNQPQELLTLLHTCLTVINWATLINHLASGGSEVQFFFSVLGTKFQGFAFWFTGKKGIFHSFRLSIQITQHP